MRINHNIASLNTYRQLSSNSANGQKSLEKLSSGLRINRAGDDAAGLAISEKMRGQIRGLEQASRNAQDSISMIQTAEGALNETQSILQRMRELSVQSSNDTATDVDRSAIQKEITQLKSEIDRISNDTEFNQKKLLNGSLATGTTAQGAKAHSVAMDRGAVASKSGNVDGQNAIYQATVAADPGVKGAVEAGTAFSTSNGGAKIITGMNDEVKITVGDNSSVIKMTGDTAANGGKAYNIDEAITELNSKVAADSTLAGKVTFAKNDAGTKIVLNAVNTGDSVSIGEGTAGQSALGALGFDKTISATTGAATFTDGAATNGSIAQFSITIGGVTKSFDLTSATDNGGTGLATVGATDTAANLNTALNQHVNQAFFGDKAAGKIVFSGASAAARTVTFDASIADDITNIQIFDKDSTQTGAATLFGALTNTQTTNTNSVTYGKAATSAATIGTVIVKDSNDKFNLTVDTGSAETITLTAKTYSSRSELVDEINNQIQANANLKDKVTATLDTDNTLKFVSASTGTTSEVKVEAPSTAAQSALSALGFKGNVQTSITGGTFDGNFATASDAKFKMTVGALTKDIDFSTGSGISSNTSITAARDAIQTAVNDAFGENVVKVDINDGKLRFTNMAATDSFAIKNDSIDTATDTMTGATKLLGYASSDGKITSTVNITGAKAGEEFVMSVGGSTKVVTVGAGANQTENIAALQTGLDNAWGTNVFKVAANGNGFDIESTLNNVDVSINADGGGHTGGAMYLTSTGTGVKFTRMANDSLTLDNTSTKGTAAETAGDLQETTKLVNLTDNDGLNLGLTSGNVITVSGTKEGVEFSSKLTVTDNTTVKELMTAMQAVPELAAGSIKLNEQSGQLEFEGASGAANNIKNLKLTAQKSATDNTGVNTFNNKAGNFIQTQEAQDTRTGNEVQFQIGANQSQVTNLGINDMSAKALGVDKIDVSSAAGAGAAITLVDNALASVSNERAKLGAVQNRLEHTINNLATSTENLTASESRIRDVDMAKEMMEFTKNNILSQAAQAMMAQANQQPQGVLQLLR